MADPREFDQGAALAAATTAAGAAAQTLMRRFRPSRKEPLEVWTKGPGALVTDADIAADRAIAAALEQASVPGDFVSEESRVARAGRDLTWLIDPLCGTTPFSTGMGHWGVNVALRSGGNIEVGALALPAQGELLSAVRGKGAARAGLRFVPSAPPGELQDVAIALEIDSGPEWARLVDSALSWTARVGQINSFASAAYPVGQILLGRLHAAVFYKIAAVHLAAGAAIAAEVGVLFTDGRGGPLDWASDNDFGCVVVGWPEIHAELIEAMTD